MSNKIIRKSKRIRSAKHKPGSLHPACSETLHELATADWPDETPQANMIHFK
jgi:hypothetical protein